MILFFTHLKLHFLHSSVHSKLSFVQMQKLRLMIVMWYDSDVQVRKLLLSLVVNPITDAVDLSPLSHRGIAGLEPEYMCVCVSSVAQRWPTPLSPVLVSQSWGPTLRLYTPPSADWKVMTYQRWTFLPSQVTETQQMKTLQGEEEENIWGGKKK